MKVLPSHRICVWDFFMKVLPSHRIFGSSQLYYMQPQWERNAIFSTARAKSMVTRPPTPLLGHYGNRKKDTFLV